MQVSALHHLAVTVTDLVRAEAFYGGVLGLPVMRRWQDESGAPRSIWFTLDEAFLAVERVPAGAAPALESTGWHCVALRIALGERTGWQKRLADAGHPVEKETPYTIYVRDPDGAMVALSHFPEPYE